MSDPEDFWFVFRNFYEFTSHYAFSDFPNPKVCYFGINRVQNSLFNFQGSSASHPRFLPRFFGAWVLYHKFHRLSTPFWKKVFLAKDGANRWYYQLFSTFYSFFEKTFVKIHPFSVHFSKSHGQKHQNMPQNTYLTFCKRYYIIDM